ncbi:hypothetical protein LCGC14_1092580 [marine sediment metagenome]|uniref:Uncharacterized protein n=1 Tax=marine sediment metagenome TaxID=412755 RepID=A0A0F9QHY8_9ZZZZ
MLNKNKNHERSRSKRAERISGDLYLYFILHTIFSILVFFIFTVGLFKIYIYEIKEITIGFLFGADFWELVFQIFAMYIISSIMGRIAGYYAIKGYCKRKKKAMKRWGELNSGINKVGLVFISSALLTSFLYSLGIIAILQDRIFDENSFLTLLGTYILLKLGVLFFVRWIVGAKT